MKSQIEKQSGALFFPIQNGWSAPQHCPILPFIGDGNDTLNTTTAVQDKQNSGAIHSYWNEQSTVSEFEEPSFPKHVQLFNPPHVPRELVLVMQNAPRTQPLAFTGCVKIPAPASNTPTIAIRKTIL
ncbi:MAG: hypothetical protein LAO76_26150 [Acidobacteriia bacterium]|nr:hypothetical protein [Terriglobia bacterium]